MPRILNQIRSKVCCEICGIKQKNILHYHHIIPKKDKRCTNSNINIAIVCPNHHSLIHSGEIIIIGVYQTTDGTKLMWFYKNEPAPLEKEFWQIKNNPLVITIKGELDDLPEERN
ncbi:MAG: HNH endonuclease signature motif containing protein [Patescibacteria group bacterium]|jgi:hypothetical protein